MNDAFCKEKKKLVHYGDVETDLNLYTIKKLQERLDE